MYKTAPEKMRPTVTCKGVFCHPDAFILLYPLYKRINRGCIADATPYFIFLFLSLYGLKIGVVCLLRYEHKGNTSTPQETRKKRRFPPVFPTCLIGCFVGNFRTLEKEPTGRNCRRRFLFLRIARIYPCISLLFPLRYYAITSGFSCQNRALFQASDVERVEDCGQVARWAFVIQTAPTVLTSTVAPPVGTDTRPTVRRNNFFRCRDFSKLNYIYYRTYTG